MNTDIMKDEQKQKKKVANWVKLEGANERLAGGVEEERKRGGGIIALEGEEGQ